MLGHSSICLKEVSSRLDEEVPDAVKLLNLAQVIHVKLLGFNIED
jgi:hypothetical protein